jgi:hypothetical protein
MAKENFTFGPYLGLGLDGKSDNRKCLLSLHNYKINQNNNK